MSGENKKLVICRGYKKCRDLPRKYGYCLHHSQQHEYDADNCPTDHDNEGDYMCECVDYIKYERKNKLKEIFLKNEKDKRT